MRARPHAKVEALRRRIDHPIVDADGHQLETVPVLLDYIREVGGSAMPERFLQFLRVPLRYRFRDRIVIFRHAENFQRGRAMVRPGLSMGHAVRERAGRPGHWRPGGARRA